MPKKKKKKKAANKSAAPFAMLAGPNPEEAQQFLQQTFRDNKDCQVMTGHLDDKAIMNIVGAFSEKLVADGEKLIKQGDEGDNFYVVDTGHFDIFVKRADGNEMKVMECGRGKVFGQLALLYNAPRAEPRKQRSMGVQTTSEQCRLNPS